MAAKSVRRATKATTAETGSRRRTTTKSPQGDGAGKSGVVAELVEEAHGQVGKSGVVDDVWFRDAVVAVVEAIIRGGSAEVSAVEREFAGLNAQMRLAGSGGAEYALAKLELLQQVAEVAGRSLVPREVARSIEPGSHAARTLARLDTDEEVFTDVIVEDLNLHPTQLSRVFRRLAELKLVERRKYGRRASWSLTGAGTAVLEQLREREVRDAERAPAELVTARSPEQFEDAVWHAAEAIEIDRPSGDPSWYLRATFDRMTGEEVFESEHLPFMVFPKLTEHSAYVRSDFARTLVRYLKLASYPSDGLTFVGETDSAVFYVDDDDTIHELKDANN